MTRLTIIKTVHTAVWLFFNAVLAYLAYAAIVNRIDVWVWIGLSLFALEGIVLLVFKMVCPLTIMARRYSASAKNNFDIYIPEWLAKYNKEIYSTLLGIVIVLIVYRVATNS